MKFQAISLALTLNLVCLTVILTWRLEARGEDTKKSCELAILKARDIIEKGRDITVTTNLEDGRKRYLDHPYGRPLIVGIVVDGNAANSVMRSPAFQKTITLEIIKNCSSVGAVAFGRYQTDWSSTVGLMSDGRVQNFKSSDCRMGIMSTQGKLPWGQEYC